MKIGYFAPFEPKYCPSHRHSYTIRALRNNGGNPLNTLDEVLPEIQRINESIQTILADIKSNTGKRNIQTLDENKSKLKQIARKLQELRKEMLAFYHPKKTIQTGLGEFEKDKNNE